MKLERVTLPELAGPEQRSGVLNHRTLAVALAVSAVFWMLGCYWDTAQSMVAIWQRSETFAHGFLIAPISGWMIWRRRRAVAALEFRPNFFALLLMGVVGGAWFLARSAGVGVMQQFCLIIMIPLIVWSVLGSQVVRALAFPLLFLLFAVPFGEFLEPVLMKHTADFVVTTLRLSGIPVFREGQLFTIPSGSWSVVEACSGLRYLIASLTVGVLYAYLTYRSLVRRALFVAASIVVPIVANWLRAYMVVMLGHLSGMKLAVGVDHLIYGWVFFGVVMLILFWIGSFWREDLDPEPAAPDLPQTAPPGPRSLASVMIAALAAAGLAAVWPAAAERLEDGNSAPPALAAPALAGGWQEAPGRLNDWSPGFRNPQAFIHHVYRKDAQPAGLYIGYYRNQRPGAQLVTSQNSLISNTDQVWRNTGETARLLVLGDRQVPAIEATLRGPSARLLAWRWYWVDGEYVVNPYWAKWLQAKSRLLGRGDDGAIVIVYMPYDDRPSSTERALQEFASAMLPAITASLENARRGRPVS
ncbi:MAG TPA: exosortase A [Burkholderiales bacterium]|nr:exosortase A [Burkholderiales bacterium]